MRSLVAERSSSVLAQNQIPDPIGRKCGLPTFDPFGSSWTQKVSLGHCDMGLY